MQILDGKQTAITLQDQMAETVQKMMAEGKKVPHLAAVLVGNDIPSQTYVNHKVKTCARIGFESTLVHLEESISQDELLKEIQKLNENEAIDGFIVQLPLPQHIAVEAVIEAIHPEKDVDGFHPINVGRMAKNLPAYISATPLGILKLLEHYQIETSGKHCVVLGRSQIVGSPMSILMAQNTPTGNCTVTICHSRTKNLEEEIKRADILIAAIGKANFVKGDWIKEGAIVIDVGINQVEDASRKKGYRLVGDVDFEEASQKASWITPVPGGVGPMTITGLLYNTLLAAQKKIFN